MKRLIVLAIILLFAWCVSLLWAGQAGAGERSPAPPPARAIPIIRPMPIPPDPFKDISNCPWRIKVVPESQAEKLMNEGWEFVKEYDVFVMDSGATEYRMRFGFHETKIILRKRVCEKKP